MRRVNLFFSGWVIVTSLVLPLKTNAQVEWTSTTNDKPWVKSGIKLARLANSTIDATIIPEVKEQTIDGFGACFNELGWTALSLLDEPGRKAILKNLFDPKEGLKLNICRMPVGANDYARNIHFH